MWSDGRRVTRCSCTRGSEERRVHHGPALNCHTRSPRSTSAPLATDPSGRAFPPVPPINLKMAKPKTAATSAISQSTIDQRTVRSASEAASPRRTMGCSERAARRPPVAVVAASPFARQWPVRPRPSGRRAPSQARDALVAAAHEQPAGASSPTTHRCSSDPGWNWASARSRLGGCVSGSRCHRPNWLPCGSRQSANQPAPETAIFS